MYFVLLRCYAVTRRCLIAGGICSSASLWRMIIGRGVVFLTFFLRGGFVNRNGMVVSLHRERVETHFDEVTDFLDFSVIFA